MSPSLSKLTVYFGERARVDGTLLADELLDLYARRSIRLSVLMRGIQGFGAKHRLRSDRLLTLSEDLPLVAVAIDADERIEALVRELGDLGSEGLLTVERVRFAEDFRRGGATGEQAAGATAKQLKLTVCVGRHERVAGEPAYACVCKLLHDAGVAGATVLLGVDGTVAGERQRARFLARNRGVPMLVVSVGDAAAIERSLAPIAETLPSALSLVEQAHVCKRDGQLLSPMPAITGVDGDEPSAKMTVVTSEAASHDGRPVYLELIRRLREQDAAGATSARGVWGFHGSHAPHGDRLLSLRRHVPVVTELIDTPQRVADLFAVVDELTDAAGLVTVEQVPVSRPLSAPLAL